MKSLQKNPMNLNSHFMSSSEFLSAISHELKTPLHSIMGFSDILRDEIGNIKSDSVSISDNSNSVTECLDYISEITQAALEMSDLISDLLDVGQVSSGNFSADLSDKIDITDVIKRAVRLNHSYALRGNISFKVEITEGIKFIKLDAKRMKQVLTNLISNAVKYSPKQSEVRIICKNVAPHPLMAGIKPNPEFLEISIIDQGFGMTPTQVQTAFQKYQTIPNPNSGKVDSFGLGLPITKHLVELQNGTIEIISEINQGTEMKLRFPYLM